MSNRATLDELFEFANKVREAGGGNPLDALMPAVPEDMSQCLIAKNLNFNCGVNSHRTSADGSPVRLRWHMSVADEETRDKIAEALGLEKYDGYEESEDELGDYLALPYGVVLPERIGQVAKDFDSVLDVAHLLERGLPVSEKQRALFEEMWPYIDSSIREAYSLATKVNDDGTIVL